MQPLRYELVSRTGRFNKVSDTGWEWSGLFPIVATLGEELNRAEPRWLSNHFFPNPLSSAFSVAGWSSISFVVFHLEVED